MRASTAADDVERPQLQTRLAHAEIARREAAPAPVSAAFQTEDKPVAWWEPGWRERFRTP